MSIETLAQNWINNLRANFLAKSYTYCHIDVTDHVLKDYPCRPISRVLIDELFLKQSGAYKIESKDIESKYIGTRTACFILDTDKSLIWRFILEIIDVNEKDPRFRIVSAYPNDTTKQIRYPSDKMCCFHDVRAVKCSSFKNRSSRMP